MTTPVVVLAGGTGTGKSTLARALEEEGAARIDADRIGHAMLERDDVRAEIERRFGAEVIGEDGRVDRGRLGARVFADAAELERLNALVHPPLVAEIVRRVDRLRREGRHGLIVIDAALWPQFEGRPPVDLWIMATAPREVRRERIERRDGISRQQAEARLDRQQRLEPFLDEADAVLDTARPRDETRAALFSLLDERLGPRWRTARP